MSRISCRKVKKILKKNFRKKTLLLKVIWLYPKERTVEIQFFYELFNNCLFQTNYRYSVLWPYLDKLKQRFPIKCECHKGGVSYGFVSYFYILHSAKSYIKVFPILSSGMLVCVIVSVRLWKFKDGGTLKARFLQCGDQVSRISFDFLKWRNTGPQKLTKMSF